LLKRFAHIVVSSRKAILAVALLLAVIGAFGMMNSSVNYDLFSYLPADLQSVQGFEILNDDFALANTAQIMVEDVTDVQTSRLVDRLGEIEGISKASWVTDFQDIAVPREWWDPALTDNYFVEDGTLITLSFEQSANDPLTRTAFEEVKEVMADETAWITGTQQLDLEDVMGEDQTKIAAAALTLVAVVLVLTIPSVVIPVLFMATIGLCIVYNLGLSYYIGQEMSYLTSMIVFALQIAVTMDYALFLYHRFEEERRRSTSDEEAMELAIISSFKAIASASLTTIAGFLALTAMQLGFGKDMGLTLARGVLITVAGVLTILPALLLVFDPLIKKVAHRTHVPDFHKAGTFVAKHAWVFTLVTALAFVPAIWGYTQMELDYDLTEGSLPDDLPSVIGQDVIAERSGSAETAFVILQDTGSTSGLDDISNRIKEIDGVTGVFSFTELVDPLIPSEFVPPGARDNFYSDDYTYVAVDIAAGLDGDETDRVLDDLGAVADTYEGETYVTSQAILIRDLERVTAGDVDRVNIISIVAVFLIIAIAFRSLTVPMVLLAAIELAIFFNQGVSGIMGDKVLFIAALAIGAIQLGATVDYAILLTSRFEEEMRKTGDRSVSIRTALGESAQSILVSAGTMFAATIGMVFLSRIGTITDLAIMISRGAAISFAVVILLLPALLVVMQPVFEKTSLGWPKRTEGR